MARPREFDEEAVVEGAMRLFWRKGYEATSLDDLSEATGLNRSSLYASFGDKRALLLMSIDRYVEQAATRVDVTLAQPIPVQQAMAQLLAGFIDSIVAGPGRNGCFLGNCAAELARHDQQAMKRVRQGMQKREAALCEAFTRARAKGDLKRNTDVTALARFFIAAMQGLRLVGKANPNREVLEDIAATMLRVLRLNSS